MLARSVFASYARAAATRGVVVAVPSRARSTAAAAAAADAEGDAADASRAAEWRRARPYSDIPGPKPLPILGNTWRFVKGLGSSLADYDFFRQQIHLREEFGDIIRLSGLTGRKDQVWLFKPEDVEMVFRNEGPWPIREGIKCLHIYRTQTRRDRFGGLEGTITSQGESWQSFRSKVNQPMMQPRSAQRYMQPINEVADEFIDRMREMRDEKNELPANFIKYLFRWSLESIAMVALDTRLGCLARDLAADAEPQRMIDSVQVVLDSFYELDFLPSPYRLISTPTWRRFVAAMDQFHDIAEKYIDVALARRGESSGREPSILERLAAEGRHVANVMASDMLFGGVDTTSYATASLLFQLAKHPEKQKILRDEIFRQLPTPTSPVTAETINEMPYLRACLKESLRILPLTLLNMRETTKDLVLSGYQVPAGTDALMCHMVISRDERHYPRPMAFLPERWLRGGADAHNAHPFVTLPFGFGVRTCVGRRFAELEIYTLVAKVLRNFRVEYPHAIDELEIRSTVLNHITSPLAFRLLEH